MLPRHRRAAGPHAFARPRTRQAQLYEDDDKAHLDRCEHFRAGVKFQIGDIEILPVQGNVYMVAGAGGNIAVQVGDDGVLLVDSGLAEFSDKVLAAIRRLSDRPMRRLSRCCAARPPPRSW